MVRRAGGKLRRHRPCRWRSGEVTLIFLFMFPLLSNLAFSQLGNLSSLNGEWSIQVRSGQLGELPADGWESTKIRIPSPFNTNTFTNGHGPDFVSFPSYPEHWGYARAAWMQREFSVPIQWAFGRTILHFEAVNLHSVVYIDGTFVGENWDGYLPFEFDITDLIVPGATHTLTVGAESPDLFREDGWRIPAPHGSFWGLHHAGIWQDVYLQLRPTVRFEDVFVSTSVSEEKLGAVMTFRNDRPEPVEAQIWCAARPLGQAPPGPVWFVGVFAVGSDEIRTVTSPRISMTEARLWRPEDPFLYEFEAGLFVSGERVHEATRRFGFREFEIDGSRFLLNSTPIKLRGDGWHWMGTPYQNEEYARLWFETARSLNLNTIRLHAQVYPQFYLDIADELGMMIIDESAWWASGLDLLYSEEGWARLADQVARMVIRDRSHPSVILWSLANEVVAAARPGDLLGGMAGYQEGMAAVKSMAKSLDGTRPIYAEGDGDGFGLFGVTSFHYPGPQEGARLDAWRQHSKPVSAGEAGIMFYATPPLVAWVLGPEVYENYHSHLSATALDLRRLLQNYRLWMDHVCPFNLPWYALEPLQFSGDPIDWPDLSLPGVKPERIGPYTSAFNPGYNPALPEFVPNPVYDAIRDEMLPVRVVCLNRSRQFFSGSTVSREVYVLNDLPRAATYAFRWEEDLSDQQRLIREETVSLGPAEDRRFALEWQLPSVGTIQDGTWIATLIEGASIVHRMETTFTVVPGVLAAPDLDTSEIAYLAPSGSPPMAAFGVSQWTALDSVAQIPPGVRTTLIAAGSRLDPFEITRLFEFINLGGRALVCRDNAEVLPPYMVDTATYETMPGSCVYATFPHPVTDGFVREDLRFWSNDGIFDTAWHGFAVGNSRVVLSAGNGDAVVADIPVGAGHLLLSQVNTGYAASETPGSLRVLLEALRYAHHLTSEASQTAAYLGPHGSVLHAFLYSLGVDLEVVDLGDEPPHLGGLRRVILDASDQNWVGQIGAEWQAALADLVETGGTVVLWGLTGETVPLLRFLLPESPLLWAANHPHLVTDGGTLAAFIHPGSLYWIDGPEGGASIMERGIVQTLTIAGREDHLVAAEFDWRALANEGEPTRTSAILRSEREPHLKPVPLSAVSSWPVGAGTVVVCQLRPGINTRKNRQLVSTVLTNLGIHIQPFPLAPDVVPDWSIDWRDLFVLATGWTANGASPSTNAIWPWGAGGPSDLLSFVRSWHEGSGMPTGVSKPVSASTPTMLSTYDTRLTPDAYLRLQADRKLDQK